MSAVAVAIGVGTGLKVYGGLRAGTLARAQKEREAMAQENEALQLDQNAKTAVAAGQRKALDQKRQTDLIASRALAYAAAGGGGASDRSVVNIISDLKGEGSYRAMIAMYEGEDQAQKLKYQAVLTRSGAENLRTSGRELERASRIKAVGDIVGAASSMYTKFNTT